MRQAVDVAVIGAGVVGLAHAYHALLKGYSVALFERDTHATGASVRNFGLLWPIGQEPGMGLDRALRGTGYWKRIAAEAGFWINNNGSLHLAYHEDEVEVLHEFMKMYSGLFNCSFLSPEEIIDKSPRVRRENLLGGMFSDTESTVHSREAIRRIPMWLHEQFGLALRFGTQVNAVNDGIIHASNEEWKADHVFVCSGADFQTLYSQWYARYPIIKCKLQMMKAVCKKPIELGPSLCAGLTLRHYAAFSKCHSLAAVDARYDVANPDLKKYGVHVLVSQNSNGELIIGDSHEYGPTVEPFDSMYVERLILDCLATFLHTADLVITERWHGVYPKLSGNIDLVVSPDPKVTIVNGLGGAGMTLGFGLAEDNIGRL